MREEEYVKTLVNLLEVYGFEQFKSMDEYGGYYHYRGIRKQDSVGDIATIISEPEKIINPSRNKTLCNDGLVISTFYQEFYEEMQPVLKELSKQLSEEPLLLVRDQQAIFYNQGQEQFFNLPKKKSWGETHYWQRVIKEFSKK